MDDPRGSQRIAFNQPQELLPGDVARPRPPRQPFAPDPPRPMDNGGEAWIVAGDAEVGEVPLQYSAESMMLIGDRPRPHEAALLVDRLERPRQTIFGGPLPHRRLARPRLAPDMEKAEERKGRGNFVFAPTRSAGDRKSTSRVLVGWSSSPNFASRLPSTACTRSASSLLAKSITKSSQ
jgi:hypothetical protein